MNLLPVIKCMLQMYRSIWWFPFMMFFVFWWTSNNASIPYLGRLGFGVYFLWLMSLMLPQQMMVRSHFGNPNEFWNTLPFSPTQIFLTQFFIHQFLFLVAFLFTVGATLLLGLIPSEKVLLIAMINLATCGITLSIVIYRFWQPREFMLLANYIIMFIVIIIGFGTLVAVAFSTPYGGPLATCVALVIGVPSFFSLKKSIGEVEPLTGKRPLREPELDVRRGKKFFGLSIDKLSAGFARLPGCKVAQNGTIRRMFDRRFSPVSRYIVMTAWLHWRCLCVFLWAAGVFGVFSFCLYTSDGYTLSSHAILTEIFIGICGGVVVTQLNRNTLCALNPLPIETRRLFYWIFGPWLAMITFFVVLAYIVASHNTTMRCGYYDGSIKMFDGFSGDDKLEKILNGEAYYGKGLHIPFGIRSANATPTFLFDEPIISRKETDSARQKATISPDAETLKVAKYFSDSLWAYYGVIAFPKELTRYDKNSKSWSISTSPFFRQINEAKMHIGLLNSLVIFPAFLFGICFGGFERKQLTLERGLPQRSRTDKNSESKAGGISSKLKRLRERLVGVTFFVVLAFFWINTVVPNHSLLKYLYPRLFLATHFTGCLIALTLSIPCLYLLSLRALRRIL